MFRLQTQKARKMTLKIVAAAVHAYGATWSLPRPNRHHHILWAIDAAGLCAISPGPDAQGFLDSDGQFVGREQALIIALEAGQIIKPTTSLKLFSEDLW
jgi:hypothetical protein